MSGLAACADRRRSADLTPSRPGPRTTEPSAPRSDAGLRGLRRPSALRNHLSNILTKLQVADRAQAIVRAREAGLGTD